MRIVVGGSAERGEGAGRAVKSLLRIDGRYPYWQCKS